jgi:hypothetical protein
MEIDQNITTPDQRTAWNGFVDNLNGQPVTEDAINVHKEANPDSPLTPELLPQIQQEHAAIRTGDSFGNLNADQLNAARTGMSPNFINETDLSKSKYPEFKVGSQDFGTDIEGYAASKAGIAPTGSEIDTSKGVAPAPESVAAPINIAPVAAPNPPTATRDKSLIPLPDYSDQSSRNKFLQNWQKEYGSLEGRGDTVLRMNEIPKGASDTAKNITTKYANQYGIDPALLYSSAMEEGMSGRFPGKGGEVKGDSGNKQFPISGYGAFGLDTFGDDFPELLKKGYLTKDFANNFQKAYHMNEKYQDINSANFKNVESAVQAKAALMKYRFDQIDSYASAHGIKLSPKAREFFGLASYNAGPGAGPQMLKDYNNNGLLKGDKFLEKRPTSGVGLSEKSYGPTGTNEGLYKNVARRLKMRDALKEQTLFDK